MASWVPAQAVQGAGAHGPVLWLLGGAREPLGQLEIGGVEAELAGLAADRREAVVRERLSWQRAQKLKHGRCGPAVPRLRP